MAPTKARKNSRRLSLSQRISGEISSICHPLIKRAHPLPILVDCNLADEKLEKARLVRMLKTVPLFSGLDEKGLGAIAAVGREVTFESGNTILKQGEPGLAFLLVLEGKAEVRKKGRPVATIERGGFLGEMTVIDDKPRSADVVALEPTRCFGIVSWSFLPVLRRHPDVAIGIISELVKRLRRLEESPSE